MKHAAPLMLALAGTALAARAQTYEAGAALIDFQVWDGSAWTNAVSIEPGGRAEWRIVVSYTGTRTDLFAMGEMLCQPFFGNVDNAGSGGGVDTVIAGQHVDSGNGIAGSMLPISARHDGSALPQYGRILPFGATSMSANTLPPVHASQLQVYRHTGGSNGAPLGSWIRLAGGSQLIDNEPNETWADSMAATAVFTSANNLNRINRGVSSFQQSSSSGNITTHVLYPPGESHLTGLVVFRGAFVASGDVPGGVHRVVTLSSDESFLRRWGPPLNSDNRRYMSWQTGPADSGTGSLGHRTSALFDGATITITPAPGGTALVGLAALFASRRRPR